MYLIFFKGAELGAAEPMSYLSQFYPNFPEGDVVIRLIFSPIFFSIFCVCYTVFFRSFEFVLSLF
jgi:hypothetical protein